MCHFHYLRPTRQPNVEDKYSQNTCIIHMEIGNEIKMLIHNTHTRRRKEGLAFPPSTSNGFVPILDIAFNKTMKENEWIGTSCHFSLLFYSNTIRICLMLTTLWIMWSNVTCTGILLNHMIIIIQRDMLWYIESYDPTWHLWHIEWYDPTWHVNIMWNVKIYVLPNNIYTSAHIFVIFFPSASIFVIYFSECYYLRLIRVHDFCIPWILVL